MAQGQLVDIIRDSSDRPIQQIIEGADGQLLRQTMSGELIDWVVPPPSKKPSKQILPDHILNFRRAGYSRYARA